MKTSNMLPLLFVPLLMFGCGGSDKTTAPPPPANIAPTANASVDQTVDENTEVILSGSGTDSDGSIASYSWTQTAGTTVALTNPVSASTTFTVPDIHENEILTFELTVTDEDDATGTDSISVSAIATTGSNQALLGPLSGAEIIASRLNDPTTVIESVTANISIDIDNAGTFDLALTGVSDDEWILITATGGKDIDTDDDGVPDVEPRLNNGTVYAIGKASDWREGGRITAVSDIIYRSLMLDLNPTLATPVDIENKLNEIAFKWILDINNDSNVSYKDIVSFTPYNNRSDLLIDYDLILATYVSAILSNQKERVLIDALDLLQLAKDENAYTINGGVEKYTVVSSEGIVSIESDDSDNDGIPDELNIKQIKQGVYTTTTVASNDITRISVHSGGGNLALTMTSESPLLLATGEVSLRNLVDFDLVKTSLSADNSDVLEITIPKKILQSISNGDFSLSVNGRLVNIGEGDVFIIEDDPIIGWYFCNSKGMVFNRETSECEYEDTESPFPDDYIWEEPITFNEGDLYFSFTIKEPCLDTELGLGSLSDVDYATYASPGSTTEYFNICLGMKSQANSTVTDINTILELGNNSSAYDVITLFYFDRQTGDTSKSLSNGKIPLQLSVIDESYTLDASFGKKNPDGVYSSGLSFENNKIGDALWSLKNKLWMKLYQPYDFTGDYKITYTLTTLTCPSPLRPIGYEYEIDASVSKNDNTGQNSIEFSYGSYELEHIIEGNYLYADIVYSDGITGWEQINFLDDGRVTGSWGDSWEGSDGACNMVYSTSGNKQ